jgi:hypothetical protein
MSTGAVSLALTSLVEELPQLASATAAAIAAGYFKCLNFIWFAPLFKKYCKVELTQSSNRRPCLLGKT